MTVSHLLLFGISGMGVKNIFISILGAPLPGLDNVIDSLARVRYCDVFGSSAARNIAVATPSSGRIVCGANWTLSTGGRISRGGIHLKS